MVHFLIHLFIFLGDSLILLIVSMFLSIFQEVIRMSMSAEFSFCHFDIETIWLENILSYDLDGFNGFIFTLSLISFPISFSCLFSYFLATPYLLLANQLCVESISIKKDAPNFIFIARSNIFSFPSSSHLQKSRSSTIFLKVFLLLFIYRLIFLFHGWWEKLDKPKRRIYM